MLNVVAFSLPSDPLWWVGAALLVLPTVTFLLGWSAALWNLHRAINRQPGASYRDAALRAQQAEEQLQQLREKRS